MHEDAGGSLSKRHELKRAGAVGGSLFRVGIGATPFLLPLMLQLGFGLSPVQSGLLTFVSAMGAIFMKLGRAPAIMSMRMVTPR